MIPYLATAYLLDGDYGTPLWSLVLADSEEEAEEAALLGLCHHDLGEGAEFGDGGIYDRYGEVHYRITYMQQLSDKQAETLKNLGIF